MFVLDLGIFSVSTYKSDDEIKSVYYIHRQHAAERTKLVENCNYGQKKHRTLFDGGRCQVLYLDENNELLQMQKERKPPTI